MKWITIIIKKLFIVFWLFSVSPLTINMNTSKRFCFHRKSNNFHWHCKIQIEFSRIEMCKHGAFVMSLWILSIKLMWMAMNRYFWSNFCVDIIVIVFDCFKKKEEKKERQTAWSDFKAFASFIRHTIYLWRIWNRVCIWLCRYSSSTNFRLKNIYTNSNYV